jgi:ADP-heptose:LPS heptosyltransferase
MRALVVRLSAIGDCVMSVPVAVSIRQAAPDAEIWWAVEPRCEAVLDTSSLVNRKVYFDRQGWKRRRAKLSVWREQVLTYACLRRAHFDLGIELQGHFKTALALRIASPKKRIAAVARDEGAKRLNPVAESARRHIHVVERNLGALAELGPFNTQPHWIMPSVEKEATLVRSRILKNKPLATISVGAGHTKKILPGEKWGQTASEMLKRGFQVAFLGGADESAPPIEGTIDFVGKLSLAETMAAVTLSRIHIAADTGTGHLAAAYGIPVVSVFGATDPVLFRPYTNRCKVVEQNCKPAEVPVSAIVEACEALLEECGEPVSH